MRRAAVAKVVKQRQIIVVSTRSERSDSGSTKFGSTPRGGLSAGVVKGSSVAIAQEQLS